MSALSNVNIKHLNHLKKYNFNIDCIATLLINNYNELYCGFLFSDMKWIYENLSQESRTIIFKSIEYFPDLIYADFSKQEIRIMLTLSDNTKSFQTPNNIKIMNLILLEILTYKKKRPDNIETILNTLTFYQPSVFFDIERKRLYFDVNNPISIHDNLKELCIANQFVKFDIIPKQIIHDLFLNLSFDLFFLQKCITLSCVHIVDILHEITKKRHPQYLYMFEETHQFAKTDVDPIKTYVKEIDFAHPELFNLYSVYCELKNTIEEICISDLINFNIHIWTELKNNKCEFTMFAILLAICINENIYVDTMVRNLRIFIESHLETHNLMILFPNKGIEINKKFCELFKQHSLFSGLIKEFLDDVNHVVKVQNKKVHEINYSEDSIISKQPIDYAKQITYNPLPVYIPSPVKSYKLCNYYTKSEIDQTLELLPLSVFDDLDVLKMQVECDESNVFAKRISKTLKEIPLNTILIQNLLQNKAFDLLMMYAEGHETVHYNMVTDIRNLAFEKNQSFDMKMNIAKFILQNDLEIAAFLKQYNSHKHKPTKNLPRVLNIRKLIIQDISQAFEENEKNKFIQTISTDTSIIINDFASTA